MKSRAGGVEDRLNEIVEKVMYREGKSSNEIATDMFKFFEKAVKKSNYWDKPEDLKEKIILIGKNIIEKDKMNFVVRNCVVRMLKLIKEASKEEETQLMSLKSLAEKTQDQYSDNLQMIDEHQMKKQDQEEDLSDTKLELKRENTYEPKSDSILKRSVTMAAPKSKVSKNDPHRQEFMDILLEKINEVNDDLECNKEGLIEKASEHINDGDLILTYGCSSSLIEFLIEAKASARFEVIVCESAPTFSGHKTAKILAEKGIQTNLVQDAAVFGVMSRCDKVILSPVGVMATGGLVCHTGGLMIAHAAKAHEVPLFSLASMYKLTPLHPIDSHTYNELLSPETIFRLQENDKMDNIEVIIPAYDYIPPKLVSLILTNMEGYTPENIYRAFNQLYGKQGTLNFAE